MTDRHWRTAAFTLGVVVIAAAFFILGGKVNSAEDTADTNQDAIRKSCVILTNVIIQSSNSDVNKLFLGELVKLAREHGDEAFLQKFNEILKKDPSGLKLAPNCKQLAENPKSIKQLPTPTAGLTVTPTPTPTASQEGESGG